MKRALTGICALLLGLGLLYFTADSSPAAAAPAAPAVAAASGNPVPLFNSSTKLEPDTIIDTPTALITHGADRGRDRHCREWMFKVYEHYLADYWIDRTNSIEVVDTVAKGGKTVTFNMTSLKPLNGPNLRCFFEGKGTVAQYSNNLMSKTIDPLHYQAVVNMNTNERRPLKIGDRIEIEFSPFLKLPVDPPGSRTNYYGTCLLYVVGKGGFQPWAIQGNFEEAKKNRAASLDSFPLPELALSGGMTTRHENYSDEPKALFDQLATNIAPQNSQPFVLGRRLAHTEFDTGIHSEPGNPIFKEQVGRLGARFSATSCAQCKGSMPSAVGKPMLNYLVKVGTDAKGTPHPQLGAVLQPQAPKGTPPEGSVAISAWVTTDGTFGDGTKYTLQKPTYKFTGVVPEFYSVRLPITQPFGLGLFEAVDEGTIASIAATNGGRMNLVTDPQTGQVRMGRYGYKATQATLKQQISKRLNDAMGITTSIYPKSDRGSAQADLDKPINMLPDADLENIYRYYSLRAVPPRQNFTDPEVLKGEALFTSTGCVRCHAPTLKTSAHHPLAELRNQTIHPYTDLLLHDMGPGLADNMGEGSATGSEWRTQPLWGLSRIGPAMGSELYLHDGRARNVSEAILWHGGQATGPKEKFRNMPADDRAALVKFLKSL